jgi:predicted ATPase
LLQALDDAFARRGTVAVASGELGIGKTRLLDELSERARARGAIVAAGRWYESAEQPADIGLRDALRDLIADDRILSALDTTDPTARELARLGPEFARALGLRPGEAPDREGEPYQLWRAVQLLIDASCSVAPTVVILDDLQWADPVSLGLLAFLAQRVGRLPVLLVGAYRDEDVPSTHALHETIAELVRTPSFRSVSLSGLALEEVGALAGSIAGLSVSHAFAAALHRQTRGNPLFVAEVVRRLLETDELPEGTLAAASLASDVEVSRGLRNVITRRLDALSSGCRALLARAAVIGREFDVALMERLGCSDRSAVMSDL